MGDQRVDRFADDVGSFLDERDFLPALDRANFLDQIGGVFELYSRQRLADLFESSPRHHALRRAHETGQSDHADALGANFFQPFDHRLAVGAARWADVFDPVLRQTPPLDFVGAAHDGRDIAFERQHRADFSLGAADLGDVAGVGAELVPMAFVRQADERMQAGLAHVPAQQSPAAVSFFQ